MVTFVWPMAMSRAQDTAQTAVQMMGLLIVTFIMASGANCLETPTILYVQYHVAAAHRQGLVPAFRLVPLLFPLGTTNLKKLPSTACLALPHTNGREISLYPNTRNRA